jgi:hypothetical protein
VKVPVDAPSDAAEIARTGTAKALRISKGGSYRLVRERDWANVIEAAKHQE